MDDQETDQSAPSSAHVEFANLALDRFSDWVRFADAKAGAVMVVLGVALSDLLARAGSLADAWQAKSLLGWIATVAFWLACALAALTLSCVVSALFPRVTPREESLAYFGDVAKYEDAGKYRKALLDLPPDRLVDHIFTQAFDLARIARTKFERLRFAYRFVFIFLALWGIARLALAWGA